MKDDNKDFMNEVKHLINKFDELNLCPLLMTPLEDPVVLPSGNTIEKQAAQNLHF